MLYVDVISWETELWGEVQGVLKVTQTAAVLEVLNALFGIVRSPWVTVLMQVFSRVWTLWAVMDMAPTAQHSLFFLLACTSWALVEVPRYLFYALSIANAVPYPLFWLRYSLFAILYPTGITGELGCMYLSLFELWGKAGGVSDVPMDKLVLMVLIALVVVTYVPGSPTMYKHMLKTRKKQFQELKEGGKKRE
ncbi:hypothetical protein EON64_18985 [archaeon]|nr:MAG: hypothetical protein EON64_18985 [archaeon]